MPRLLAVVRARKHADHDQSDHGNWADGRFAQGTPRGSNGFNVISAIRNQLPTDQYKTKVYAAANKLFPTEKAGNTAPVGPKRKDFATYEEYAKAFKEYDKAFDKYAQTAMEYLASDTGRESLDGSLKGVKAYVQTVCTSDWFREAFGDGRAMGGIPPVKVTTAGDESGSFRMKSTPDGFMAETSLRFNKAAFTREPTILHEIAHFATAISATDRYEPHGVEFAKNLVFISEQVAGSEFAELMRTSLIEEGVPIDN